LGILGAPKRILTHIIVKKKKKDGHAYSYATDNKYGMMIISTKVYVTLISASIETEICHKVRGKVRGNGASSFGICASASAAGNCPLAVGVQSSQGTFKS